MKSNAWKVADELRQGKGLLEACKSAGLEIAAQETPNGIRLSDGGYVQCICNAVEIYDAKGTLVQCFKPLHKELG